MEARQKNSFEDVMSRFPDAEKRFHTSPIFASTIHQLMSGADPHKLLSDIMYAQEQTMSRLVDCINGTTPTYIVSPLKTPDLPK